MTPLVISDREALKTFTANIRKLVEAGYAARATSILREVALANGHTDLHAATEPSGLHLEIVGWDHVRRDGATAVANSGSPVDLTLNIVGRSLTSPDCEQGLLHRSLKRADGDGRVGFNPDDVRQVVQLIGLEKLFSYLRLPGSTDLAGFDRERRDAICAWLIVAHYVRAASERCKVDPLPENVTLVLGPDFTAHSRECGFDDLLPKFCCRIEPQVVASANAAEELHKERLDENRAQFQKTWEDDFAERREIHRMLRYFPFYRFKGRNSLAELWEQHLDSCCDIVGLAPFPKISWRMSKCELTNVLHQIAEAKKVPDIEAALDPANTDKLHAKWLEIARAANFRIGPGLSLFQVELATALHKGGPWVKDRWERAGPYDAEQ